MANFEKTILLIKLLNDKRHITVDDIKRSLNVEERQARRYIAIMKQHLNIDVSDDGTYSTIGTSDIKKTIICNNELSFILGVLDKIKDVIDEEVLIETIKQKIFSSSNLYATHSIICSDVTEYAKIKDVHALLETYIREREIISFDYQKKQKHYIAEPHKIIFTNGIWYLLAYNENKFKTFTIEHIKNIETTGEIFMLRKNEVSDYVNTAKTIWHDEAYKEDIQIKISPYAAYYFRRKCVLPDQKIIREYKDGSVDVCFTVSSENEFRFLLLGTLGEFSVISPEKYQNLVSDLISKYK